VTLGRLVPGEDWNGGTSAASSSVRTQLSPSEATPYSASAVSVAAMAPAEGVERSRGTVAVVLYPPSRHRRVGESGPDAQTGGSARVRHHTRDASLHPVALGRIDIDLAGRGTLEAVHGSDYRLSFRTLQRKSVYLG
jgi:hypothetical protein